MTCFVYEIKFLFSNCFRFNWKCTNRVWSHNWVPTSMPMCWWNCGLSWKKFNNCTDSFAWRYNWIVRIISFDSLLRTNVKFIEYSLDDWNKISLPKYRRNHFPILSDCDESIYRIITFQEWPMMHLMAWNRWPHCKYPMNY